MRTQPRSPGAALIAAFLAAALVAGCSAAGGQPSPSPTPRPTPTAVPGVPGGSGSVGTPQPSIEIPRPFRDPEAGQATIVTPVGGLKDLHPANVQRVRAAVVDGDVQVELRWWSGVAPCTQLALVQQAKDDAARTVKLTVIEGSTPLAIACDDMAQLKATFVDLGKLAAGIWTIQAEGDAPAVQLEVG